MKTVNSLKKDDAKVIVTTIYNPAGNMKLPSTLNKIVEDIIENMTIIKSSSIVTAKPRLSFKPSFI